MIRLHLFGALSYSMHTQGGGADARTHIAGRPASLLAFLALGQGRYFSRNELLTALWPEQGSTSGNGCLNTVLWRLRKVLEQPPLRPGTIIASDRRGGVGLHSEAPVSLDVNEFSHLVLPPLAKPLERTTAEDIDALRRGIDLYTADILTDLSDEWALREREKHRRHRLNALGRLMQICTLAQDFSSAIRYAQAILDQDELREDIHRGLMRLFLANGQRALALRQFENCRAALKRELAIQPMPETLALYQAIADQAIPVATHSAEPRLAHAVEPTMGHLLGSGGQAPFEFVQASTPLSARELIEEARRHLAIVDTQLQLSLPLV